MNEATGKIYAVVLLAYMEEPSYERFFATRAAAERYLEVRPADYYSREGKLDIWEEDLHS